MRGAVIDIARVDSRAAFFDGRRWVYLAWWLCVWNAAVPIRLVGMLIDGAGRPGFRPEIGPSIATLALDQTSWAIVTYLMFRLALRARREPVRRVVTILAVLAVPLMVLRFWATSVIGQAMGRPALPAGRALWYNAPFYLFLLMAAAALGFLVVYMQRERDNAVLHANLQAELASARLQTLRLQLNPHFLFNALNSIASLVHSDAAKADTAIAALSSFLRASLAVTHGEETTLENELRLVDAYLEIELLRVEWLTVDLDVPDALRSACVPTFVLQLLVENAIRHGLAPRRTPGRVVIAARRDDDQLQLCVSDDGVGLDARSGNSSLGIGLRNVRARLAQLYGFDGVLTLEPSTPHGTVATIRIPYRVGRAEPALTAVDA
jgi:glucose-6-phosphate-specific signal transduction histidine kinase